MDREMDNSTEGTVLMWRKWKKEGERNFDEIDNKKRWEGKEEGEEIKMKKEIIFAIIT
jgi:hypothetical protein